MEGVSSIERLIIHAKEYIETRFDLLMLDGQEKVATLLSSVASALILGAISFMILLFFSLALAWWIGACAESPSIGFISVGGIYVVLAIIFYVNREKLVKSSIINSILSKINIHEED
jgi:hypothetical protein